MKWASPEGKERTDAQPVGAIMTAALEPWVGLSAH